MLWLGVYWHLLGAFLADGTPSTSLLAGGLVAGAAVVGVVLVAAAFAARIVLFRAHPAPYRGAALVDRSRVAGVPRQRDPDAAGRSRPRAPGVVLPSR